MGARLPFNPFDVYAIPEALHFLICEPNYESNIMNLFDTHGAKDQVVSTFFNFLRDNDHKNPLNQEEGAVRWKQPRLAILRNYVQQLREAAAARGMDNGSYVPSTAGGASTVSTPGRSSARDPPGSASSYGGASIANIGMGTPNRPPSQQPNAPPSSAGGGPESYRIHEQEQPAAAGAGVQGGGLEEIAALADAGELEEELAGVRREKADLIAKCRLAMERIEHLDTLERDLCEEIAKARIQHLVRGLGRGIFAPQAE